MSTRMKLGLSALVFLLLLFHVSSLPFSKLVKPTQSQKKVFGKIVKALAKNNFKDGIKDLFKHFANDNRYSFLWRAISGLTTITNLEGVSLLKRYFCEFGYYPNSTSGTFTNELDSNLISAVQEYQTYYKLSNVEDTLNQILQPRCGVPDMNYESDSKSNLWWPKGRFPGEKKNLTYSFEPESRIPENMTAVFRRAFQRWSESIPRGGLSLTEATSPDHADIKVGLYAIDRNFDNLVVADAVMESNTEHDTNVVGKIRLDFDESWALQGDDLGANVVDLETVAMHQIGHILGLEHSNDTDTVMYPSILPSKQRKVELAEDDVEKLQQLYPSSAGDTFPFPSVLLLTAAFFILVY